MSLRTRLPRTCRQSSSVRIAPCLGLAASLVLAAGPAHALKVGCYNLLNYDNLYTARDSSFTAIVAGIGDLDVLAVEEMQDATAMTHFRLSVLDVAQPGQWAAAQFFDDPSQSFNQALFYRIGACTVVDADTLGNDPRDISHFTILPAGYLSSAAEVTIFATHFKAGAAGSDETTRQAEAERLRLFMNQMPAGTNMIVCGDFNMRESIETAYVVMTQSQADNDGRMFDPIAMPGTWYNNFNFRFIHTQSTRTTTLSPGDGGATGGIDDRFDQILITSSLQDGEGLDYVAGSYTAYGEDGNHFNLSINASPTNTAVGQAMADDLQRASDHLPVFLVLQVPAKISTDASLGFGTVIVGATAQQTLTVSNGASAPADELDYTLTGDAQFTAPGGSFQDATGGGGNGHTVTMLTGSSGNKSGSVTVNSDDIDDPSHAVPCTGTVLDHAVPSLDSGSQVTSDNVGFGSHDEGSFSDESATVHNFGYDPLQALLNVYDAQITGGDGRFSIVSFGATNVGGTPASWDLHFDDSGAATSADTTYDAVLTFSTRDEQGIPGAANQASLTVNLSATVNAAASVGVGDEPLPAATVLRANVPNPFSRATTVRFDLAAPGIVRLAVYDVRGRLVRVLRDEALDPGRYQTQWDGTGDNGRATPPGIYFYVLDGAGERLTRRMTKLN